ncbi:class F sortase [Kribbella flavida]|nr:class F sortase [Kribbella flavida]
MPLPTRATGQPTTKAAKPPIRTPQRPTAGTPSPELRPTPSAEPSRPSTPGRTRKQAAPLRRSTPMRVTIPSIGMDSHLMRLGLTADGSLQVPPNAFPAGWFTGAPTPGERGPAVIAGHVRWSGRAGVFARLARLKPGDTVTVTRQDRSTAVFRVNRVQQYAKSRFPSAAVYGDIRHAGLRLITCGGYDPASREYEANLVAFADLIA